MFKRVTIIGLGLIGGSLGLAIKEKRLAREVVGVSRRLSTIRKAEAMGAVDYATLDIKEGVEGADLIILATPVLKIIEILEFISELVPKGVVITDVGSTKEDIVKKAKAVLPDDVHFVGSHPLAGSEKSGIIYANKDLFKGAYCILTKTGHTYPKALDKVRRFWNALGMKVEITSPHRHDTIVSRLSHLPHSTSVGLCNSCSNLKLYLAAKGFEDTTRIASGDPELWKDIFITNRKNIAKDIDILRSELLKIEKALKDSDDQGLLRLFRKAKFIRDSIKCR